MASSYTLSNTFVSLSVQGAENEIVGTVTYPFSVQYLFGPKGLVNGTGSGSAQRVFILPITLTAVAANTSAPSNSVSTTLGSIGAGTYTLAMTWYNAQGETQLNTTLITTASGLTGSTNQITVTAPTALPTGALGMNVYLITTTGSGTANTKVGTAATNSVVLNTLPNTGVLPSATLNTATIPTQVDLTSAFSALGFIGGINQVNAQDPPTQAAPAPSGVNFSNSCIAPPAAPTVANATTGGFVAANTYYVVITYVNAAGETIGSAQSSTTTTGTTSTITVTAPAASGNATGWKVYMGTVTSGPYFEQGSEGAIPIGTANFVFTTTPTNVGPQPPTISTTGDGVKTIAIENTDTTAGQRIYLGGGTNAWTNALGSGVNQLQIGPGGMYFQHSPEGVAVTSTNKIIQLLAEFQNSALATPGPVINLVLAGEGV